MIANQNNGLAGTAIESRADYEDNPTGQYKYWYTELGASKEMLKSFNKQGDSIIKRFLADTRGKAAQDRSSDSHAFKLNLFYANTTTLMSALYGNLPTIDVSRRFNDAKDDVGRVAAEIMERMLNDDVAVNGEECDQVLRTALFDRLTVGLGIGRVRYTATMEEKETAAVLGEDGEELAAAYNEKTLMDEDCLLDYVHWRDIRWGWARNFGQIPWIGFRSWMTKDEATKRFGEVADQLEYKRQQALSDDAETGNNETSSAWQKAEVWEIWDKNKKQVVWCSIGYDKVLDTKADPLGLEKFYPCPPFFIANATSTLYAPTSDYHLAQDLYNEVDKLQTRIAIITEAVKVVGLYDAGSAEIARMFKEGTDNDLIPVENWALFAEKGGIVGQIDWFPIGDVVAALAQLITVRDQTIALLQQITGMSDLMRGELNNQYEGVGQTQIKAQFGSIRIQALQDSFSVFASKLFQLKAEVISKHFDKETIAKRSNLAYTFDEQLAQPALDLIKDYEAVKLAINIRPETLAMIDYGALKQERGELITSIATYMQSAAPLVEADPSTKPFLLRILQWGVAAHKGASEIEGVLDQAIEQSEKTAKEAAENPKPDPAKEAEQMKQQFDQQMAEFKAQSEMQKIQAKGEMDMQVRQNDLQADLQEAQADHFSQLQIAQTEMQNVLTEIKAKLEADILKEEVQAKANIAQTQASAAAEVEKDVVEAQINTGVETAKTQLKINEIAASSESKINEIKAQPAPVKVKENG
jgi:hypothetical protein